MRISTEVNGKKRVRRVAALLCGAVLAAAPALAQDAGGPPPPPPPGQHGPGGPGMMMRGMDRELNLTADQKTQVHAIMEETRTKAEALRDNSSLSQKDRREQMMKLHEDSMAKVRALLTDEQKTKFDQMQKERREHMRGPRGEGAGQGEGSAPPPPPPPQQ